MSQPPTLVAKPDWDRVPEEFKEECGKVFEDIRDHIMAKPILQRANISKRFYLKTSFSSLGLGFALCQPDGAD
jgi:hypothetical protein